jgi:hypothetical protein
MSASIARRIGSGSEGHAAMILAKSGSKSCPRLPGMLPGWRTTAPEVYQ